MQNKPSHLTPFFIQGVPKESLANLQYLFQQKGCIVVWSEEDRRFYVYPKPLAQQTDA